MSARHAVLSVGALGVLGLGVYLFLAVRAESAAPPPPAPVAERAAPPAEPPAAPSSEPRATAPPSAPAARMPGWIPSHPGAPASPPPGPPPSVPGDPAGGDDLGGPRLDLVMDEANKAYDRGDYDDAKTVAGRVLARQPANIRMLRIMVSASCIDGDSATATASFTKLPAGDQAQMRTRCARYGVTFPEK